MANHVVDLLAEHAARGLVQPFALPARLLQLRVLGQRLVGIAGKQRHAHQLPQTDQAGAHAVVGIMGVVGDLIGQIGQLGFQTRPLAKQETLAHAARLTGLQLPRMLGGAVFQNPFPGFKAQVQPAVVGVTLFERIDHAQALHIVLKAAKVLHAVIEHILARMAKRRVAEVMGQADRLGQVFVDAQCPRHRAAQLRHLDRVREAGAEQVALVVQKNLGFVDQTAESGGMHDPVAVTLKSAARGRRLLCMQAALAAVGEAGIRRQAQLGPDLLGLGWLHQRRGAVHPVRPALPRHSTGR